MKSSSKRKAEIVFKISAVLLVIYMLFDPLGVIGILLTVIIIIAMVEAE